MISKNLEISLNLAFRHARSKCHEFMTVEHMLLALLDNDSAAGVLGACGTNIDELRSDLDRFVEEIASVIPASDLDREIQPDLGFQRVLQRAVFHVQSSGKKEVTGANLLVAIFSERESHAVYCLQKHGVERAAIVNYMDFGISQKGEKSEESDECGINEREGINYEKKQYQIIVKAKNSSVFLIQNRDTVELSIDQVDEVVDWIREAKSKIILSNFREFNEGTHYEINRLSTLTNSLESGVDKKIIVKAVSFLNELIEMRLDGAPSLSTVSSIFVSTMEKAKRWVTFTTK